MSLQGVTPSFEQHHISSISSFFFLRTATDPAVYSTSGTSRPVEFIDIVPGRFDATVDCNSVPYLILDDEHSDFLQLLSKFLNIKADNTVIQFHIGSMVDYFQ